MKCFETERLKQLELRGTIARKRHHKRARLTTFSSQALDEDYEQDKKEEGKADTDSAANRKASGSSKKPDAAATKASKNKTSKKRGLKPKAAQSETEEEDDNSVAHGDLSQAEDTLEDSDEESESPTD